MDSKVEGNVASVIFPHPSKTPSLSAGARASAGPRTSMATTASTSCGNRFCAK